MQYGQYGEFIHYVYGKLTATRRSPAQADLDKRKLPPQAENGKVPAVYWLSGLTCSDDNFRTKAGAQRYAAELGLALIIPDTSPRGADVPDAADRYDLGQGAGFYVNATRQPWSKHYHMYDYVVQELPALIEANLPVVPDLKSIAGHSMGGHGALNSSA